MNRWSKNKHLSIIKMIGNSLTMQIVLFFVAFVSIVDKDVISIKQFWLVGKYCLITGVLCYICIFYFGIVLRRAFLVHALLSVSVISWVLPLLHAGYGLSSKNQMLLFVIALLCFLDIVVTYMSTISKLTSKDIPAVRSGRLDVENGSWDLDKHLIFDESREMIESVAKTVIPFGTILGTLLFRNFYDQALTIAILFDFLIATVIIGGMGIHIAASKYIILIEDKYKKHIRVK